MFRPFWERCAAMCRALIMTQRNGFTREEMENARPLTRIIWNTMISRWPIRLSSSFRCKRSGLRALKSMAYVSLRISDAIAAGRKGLGLLTMAAKSNWHSANGHCLSEECRSRSAHNGHDRCENGVPQQGGCRWRLEVLCIVAGAKRFGLFGR